MPKTAAPALPSWQKLPEMTRAELAATWQQAFSRPIPKKLFRNTVVYLLGYRLQEIALGGLSPASARALARYAPDKHTKSSRPPPRRLKPGTRLLRSWQGRAHTVTVTDDGYTYEDKPYRSLSVIARTITGTPWSGPAFFGLRERPSKRA